MTANGMSMKSGLDSVLESWNQRFVFDELGRLVGLGDGGGPPRLILARSAEGCVWRFHVDLAPDLVAGIAKLAGRERGWRHRHEDDADPPAPERLVMIARLLGEADSPATFVRESILRDGRLHAEIWSFD